MKLSSFNSFDGTKLNYYSWLIEKPVGTVVVFHGMAEHGARYGNFADFLNKNGYDMYAMDFRGHGKNIRSLKGYFADKNGWEIIVSDIKLFIDHVFNKAVSNEVVLFGHSMGSLLLRSYLIEYDDNRIGKIVLSGTPAAPPPWALRGATVLTKIIIALGGRRKPFELIDKLIFGQYSKSIKNPSTAFDWISHDKEVVINYITDPLCGFVCTGSFYRDLLSGIKHCNNPINIVKINPTKNILILSGSEDPVGDLGKAPQALWKKLSSVLQNGSATLKVYQGCRHEILNEVDCTRVYKDVLEFIQAPVSS